MSTQTMKTFALLLVSAALFNVVLSFIHGQRTFPHTFIQSLREDFAESQELTQEIRGILYRHGVKYDERQLKLALKGDDVGLTDLQIDLNTDQDAQLRKTHVILLQEGDNKAGLRSIYEEHGDDFGLGGKEQISTFIEQTMVGNDPVEINSTVNGGINVVYPIKGKDYLRVITSSDGFIVTAYPISSRKVEWEISIDDTQITVDDIILATDQSAPLRETHIIDLGEGNSTAGLKHIHRSHAASFQDVEGILGKEAISQFIRHTLKSYTPVEVVPSGHNTIRVMYKIRIRSYLTVIVDRNGFIVTAYPTKSLPAKSWSINSKVAGITYDQIDSITDPDSPLRKYCTISLEEGDSFSGLERIYKEHRNDFQQHFGESDNKKASSEFIRRTMEENRPAYVIRSESGGIYALYPTGTDAETYLRVITTSSGSITTAYPTDYDIEWIHTILYQGRRHQIYLVEGHSKAGLQHIHEIHGEEFKELEGAGSKSGISKLIEETVQMNDQLVTRTKERESGKFNMIYRLKSDKFLRVITSSNGFIITAYPMPKRFVEWEITIKQAGISKIDPNLLFYDIISFQTGNTEVKGLKQIYEDCGPTFKLVKGIDSKEGISEFTKRTMETRDPIDVMRGSNERGGISVLYFTGKVYLLVQISAIGFIHSIKLKVHKDRDQLTWSMTIKDAGVTDDAIKECFTPKAFLSRSHILFLDKSHSHAGLTWIYEHNFQARGFSKKGVSQFIRNIMQQKHKSAYFACQSIRRNPYLKVQYEISPGNYLHVFISSDGYIYNALIV